MRTGRRIMEEQKGREEKRKYRVEEPGSVKEVETMRRQMRDGGEGLRGFERQERKREVTEE